MNSISSRSTKALYWVMAGAIGKMTGQLFVQITLARILDPVVYGQYAVMLAVFGIGLVFAEAGFGAALIQKKELTSSDVSLALGWSAAFASIIVLLIFISAPLLARQFGDTSLEPVLRVCAMLIPFQVLLNISSSLLRRELYMKGLQLIQLVAYIGCFGGVAITLAAMQFGIWSLVAGFAAQTVFSLVATYSIIRHTLRPSLCGERALVAFGLKSLVTDLTSWSMDNLDRFFIGRFWGLYPLGLYSVAFNLSKAPSGLLVSAAQSITFASAARLHNDQPAVHKGFLIVLSAMALTTIPLFGLTALQSETILRAVYGLKWINAAPYMTALAVSIPLISMGAITASILRGIGFIGSELRIQVTTCIILFSAFFVFRSASLELAVWAVPLAYLTRFIMLLLEIRKRFKLSTLDLIRSIRGGIILAAVAIFSSKFTSAAPWALAKDFDLLPLLVGCSVALIVFATNSTWFLGGPLAAIIRIKLFSGFSRPPSVLSKSENTEPFP